MQLPTIDVTGDQGGYQAAQQSINRLQTALLNIPQTVNVVPQQEIQERRLSTMHPRKISKILEPSPNPSQITVTGMSAAAV